AADVGAVRAVLAAVPARPGRLAGDGAAPADRATSAGERRMSRWGHGLIVGKLRPPHTGHSYLIRTALEQVDRLTVAVCEHASDPIPAELRAAWVRELFPT